MKALLIGAALLALSTAPSFAAITCWYDEAGVYSGADETQPPLPNNSESRTARFEAIGIE